MVNGPIIGEWDCAPVSAVPVVPPQQLLASGEHIAELVSPDCFDSLHRKDDFFDEGVDTVFGMRNGEVELQAFCFQVSQFTAAQARDWLRERRLETRLFTAGGIR
jgi:hypothetical protein